jgi:hypothetical protein
MSIRTTVALDEDVHDRLKRESRRRGVSFGKAVNEVLRSGLLAEKSPPSGQKFRVKARSMGGIPGLNYDNIEELLELAEGPYHR